MVCVLSHATENILNPGSWASFGAEQNINWALAHGHSFTLLTGDVVPSGMPLTWSKIWAAESLLARAACDFGFYLDADAVVHSVTESLEPIIKEFFKPPPVHMLMSVHELYEPLQGSGHPGDALDCNCSRATARCSHQAHIAEQAPIPGTRCNLNTGAFMFRNSNFTATLLRFWRNGANGICDLTRAGGKTKEQRCAHHLKARWPAHVDVVNSRIFNTLEHGGSNCFAPNATGQRGAPFFVCHMMGTPGAVRQQLLRRELLGKRAELQRLQQLRGQPYRQLTDNDGCGVGSSCGEANEPFRWRLSSVR